MGSLKLDMRPPFAANYSANRGMGHTKKIAQVSLRVIARTVKVANFHNLFFGEFCAAMRLTLLTSLSVFAIAIRSVVGMSASKQMRRVAAQRIVAAMADNEIGGNGAMGQLVCNAMRRKHFTIVSFEFSVPFDNGGLPNPAIVRAENFDVRPKSLSEWNSGCGMIEGHQNLQFWRLIRERFAVAARCFYCLLPEYFNTFSLWRIVGAHEEARS